MRLGYFLSSEEHGPAALLEQAELAQSAGFEALWISDHFHPWNREQGQSPFVWAVIGGLSRVTDLPVTTAVTCPTIRTHPAVVAQAAATAAVMTGGRFRLGVGSGEALNEHVVGARWPTADVRLEMLEEAVGVIRKLFTGEDVDHHGRHYAVEDARLFTRPETPVPIYVSGFGPQAAEFAGRIGDGFCTVTPDAELVKTFRSSGGGDKPVQAGTKVSWDRDADVALDAAHRLWANDMLPGQLAQTLPRPRDFADAMTLVPREKMGESVATGPNPDDHAKQVREYIEAGVDEVFVQQMGPDTEGFFASFERDVLPQLRS